MVLGSAAQRACMHGSHLGVKGRNTFTETITHRIGAHVCATSNIGCPMRLRLLRLPLLLAVCSLQPLELRLARRLPLDSSSESEMLNLLELSEVLVEAPLLSAPASTILLPRTPTCARVISTPI